MKYVATNGCVWQCKIMGATGSKQSKQKTLKQKNINKEHSSKY